MTFPLIAADLMAAGVPGRLAVLYLPYLNTSMEEFDIMTGERPAMFVAQIAHESGGMRYTAEIWGPTAQQLKYDDNGPLARRLGNADGEGFQWRGHGFLQTTGYLNHKAAAYRFGVDISDISGWLQSPEGACKSAAFYWATHGCNELADLNDFVGVTKKINGGLTGIEDRWSRYEAIKMEMMKREA